ncbi:MAG: hypothetical protein ACR2OZ_21155 [Verrucomicrobiales bacterium]
MNYCKLLTYFLLTHSGVAATLLYDNAPFPTGGRVETSLIEQGFATTGRFTHSGTQLSGRSSNESTGFLSVIHGDQVSVRSTSGALFDAVSVDLAEYSDVFRFPATIQFFATQSDGTSISTVFVTDGLFDGPGGIADFQTVSFPSSFKNLQSVYTKTINIFGGDNAFSMDNLTVNTVPEPNVASMIICGILVIASFRRSIKPQRALNSRGNNANENG